MIKETVTFNNLNGDEVTQSMYFHLTAREHTKIAAKYSGDIEKHCELLVESNDAAKMIDFLEDIILSAYGEKSSDGLRFIKTAEVRANFEYSMAYAELFEILLTDIERTKGFFGGLADSTHGSKLEALAKKGKKTKKESEVQN